MKKKEKLPKFKKKEKDKVYNCLLGFCNIVAVLYKMANSIEDPIVSSVLFKQYIAELIAYHDNYANTYDVKAPPLPEESEKYWQDFNDMIRQKGEVIAKYVEKLTKKSNPCSYIS